MVFIGKVNNYMFRHKRPSSCYHNYNFAQGVSYIRLYCIVMLRSHIDTHTHTHTHTHIYIYIYVTLFEQNFNCDNPKMAETCS